MTPSIRCLAFRYLLLFGIVLAFAGSSTASAQTLVITDAGNTWTIGSGAFTTDPTTGISTLSESDHNYVTAASLSSYYVNGVAPAGFTVSDGAWVVNLVKSGVSYGTVLIADQGADGSPGPELSDPFVSYSVAFVNSTNSTQTFSMSFNSSFSSVGYSPSLVRGSFGVSLTDGTDLGTGVTATPTQTAVLSLTGGGTVSAGVDLSAGTLNVTNGDTMTKSVRPANYPGYQAGPSGSFNKLTVTVSGTYSPDAELAMTGRVDVVPEPSTVDLLVFGLASALLLGHFVRRHGASRPV